MQYACNHLHTYYQACLACTKPNCAEHATPADERYFFMGVQQKYRYGGCNILCVATHRNTQQHTATHCNTLQRTTTHCNTWQLTVGVVSGGCPWWVTMTATHCNTLQHTAVHCNTLQHTAAHCNTLQRTCNLPQAASISFSHAWLLWVSHEIHDILYIL